MKTFPFVTALLTTAVITMLLIECAYFKEKSAEDLLQNPKMEAELYAAILKDNARFSKFMDKAMEDNVCKTTIAKNQGVVKMVCSSARMDSIMIADKEIMGNMMDCMVKRIKGDSSACTMMCNRMSGENIKAQNFCQMMGINKSCIKK